MTTPSTPRRRRRLSSRSHRLVCALALLAAVDGACAIPSDEGSLQVRPAQLRFGAEEAYLPGNERMGLLGTSYFIGLGHGVAVGPAAYGAVSGRRGGFFVIGAEAKWQYSLVGPLRVDTGLFVGGGGGGAAPVGGGLMLRPHVDLLWDFGPVQAGVSGSLLRFPNGGIDSHQFGLVLVADTDFRYQSGDRIGERAESQRPSGVGFERLQGVLATYRPRQGSRRVSGGELSSSLGLVGMRAERTLAQPSPRARSFWGLEAAGAASGGVAGYAEYLAALGAEMSPWGGTLVLGARAALGMGGGGDVDVGGGLLVKAGGYGGVRIARDLGLMLEAGIVRAPRGTLNASYASASLLWVLDDFATPPGPRDSARTEWATGVEQFDAPRTDGSVRRLQAVSLKGSRFLTPAFYVTGQAHSAFAGGAGAYTDGLIGVGLQQPLGSGVRGGAEMLVGAGGGGGVRTRGGSMLQPSVYAGIELSPSLSLRAGLGRIRSLRGDSTGRLDATVVDASLVFTFGVPKRTPP